MSVSIKVREAEVPHAEEHVQHECINPPAMRFLGGGMLMGAIIILLHVCCGEGAQTPQPIFCALVWGGMGLCISLLYFGEHEHNVRTLRYFWLSIVLAMGMMIPFILCQIAGIQF